MIHVHQIWCLESARVIIGCSNFVIRFCEKFVGVFMLSSKVIKDVFQWPVQAASPPRPANG